MDGSQVGARLVTDLRDDGDRVEFVVGTDDGLYQDRLIKMGWRPLGPGEFGRRLSNTADGDVVFDNFTRHVEEMIQQSARLRPVAWDVALAEFVDRTRGSGLRWWLYGSGALAVRGLDIEPGDLDLAVDDAWPVAALLSDVIVEPVTRMENWSLSSGAGPSAGPSSSGCQALFPADRCRLTSRIRPPETIPR